MKTVIPPNAGSNRHEIHRILQTSPARWRERITVVKKNFHLISPSCQIRPKRTATQLPLIHHPVTTLQPLTYHPFTTEQFLPPLK